MSRNNSSRASVKELKVDGPPSHPSGNGNEHVDTSQRNKIHFSPSCAMVAGATQPSYQNNLSGRVPSGFMRNEPFMAARPMDPDSQSSKAESTRCTSSPRLYQESEQSSQRLKQKRITATDAVWAS